MVKCVACDTLDESLTAFFESLALAEMPEIFFTCGKTTQVNGWMVNLFLRVILLNDPLGSP